MNTQKWLASVLIVGMVGALGVAVAVCEEPTDNSSRNAPAQSPPQGGSPEGAEESVSLEVARDRAKLMQAIYSATLDTMHHRYFHNERAMIPARAMEDIFQEIQDQSRIEARWIAVNLKAMGVDHEPKTDFEKKAAAELATGKPEYVAIEEGFYRRATPIPLTAECIHCHSGFFKNLGKTPRFSGLVINVPIKTPAKEPSPEKP